MKSLVGHKKANGLRLSFIYDSIFGYLALWFYTQEAILNFAVTTFISWSQANLPKMTLEWKVDICTIIQVIHLVQNCPQSVFIETRVQRFDPNRLEARLSFKNSLRK